jgi:acyl-CoA thioesterase YciA
MAPAHPEPAIPAGVPLSAAARYKRPMPATETTSHRLVLPADANHHGTLYAGSLLRYALENAYATACRAAGPAGNLMLRRVLSLECRRSVPVGALVEIRGAVLQAKQGYMVAGVIGMPLDGHTLPWMDGLLGFAQVDAAGLPEAFPEPITDFAQGGLWKPLRDRLDKLAGIRGATADWIAALEGADASVRLGSGSAAELNT